MLNVLCVLALTLPLTVTYATHAFCLPYTCCSVVLLYTCTYVHTVDPNMNM